MSPELTGAAGAGAAFAPRSLLFVPGHRPDMVRKALSLGADAVVVDLEDAVAEAEKPAARSATAEVLASHSPAAGTTVLVRVNPVGSTHFADDLAIAMGTPAAGVVLPKAEAAADVEAVLAAAGDRRPGLRVVAGIETGRGVADAPRLLAAGAAAAYFGAEDFIADVGGRRTAGGAEVLYARSRVLLACHLAGVAAIDQAVTAYRDDDAFRRDAAAGRDLGYTGKICIHPRQVALAHEAFSPTADEVAHAEAVVGAARTGIGSVDGVMVDEVHVRMARAVLARAGRPAGAP